jgi:hypothetical protein
MVYLWNIQAAVYVELENPIHPSGSAPVYSAMLLLLCSRISEVCGTPPSSTLMDAKTSRRWLIAHEREAEAREILSKYHAAADVSSPLVAFEMAEIQENIHIERSVASQSSYVDLFNTAVNRRRTFIALTVGLFTQWAGNGVVSYYLTLVLNTIGITAVSSQALINGLLQLFNWFAAILGGALMVDRMGRRSLFLVSTGGMFCAYIVWTVLTSVFERTLNPQAGHAVVAFIFIYYFFYDIAWTPLMPAYPIEIYPYTFRSRGVTAAYSITYAGLILGQFVNPIALQAIGWKYYIVFCCLLAALFVVIWFLFPETKGRTLEETAEIFDGKNHTPSSEAMKDDINQAEHEEYVCK